MPSGSADDPRESPSPPAAGLHGLRSWLDRNPVALLGALSGEGLPAAFPEAIALGAGQRVDARSLLDLVADADRAAVTDAFLVALERGAAAVSVRLAGSQDSDPVVVHYTDLRPELGVVVRFAALAATDLSGASPPPPPAAVRPRLGMVTKAANGVLRSVDANAELLLGRAEDELVGRSSLELIHPDDRGRAVDNWLRMVSGGGNQSVRLRYARGDGTWIWLETSNDPGDPGAPERSVVCQLVDISDEMAATEALRHSEQLLRRMAEAVPVGLLHVGTDGAVSYANQQVHRLFGAERLEHLDDLTALLVPEEAAALASGLATVGRSGEDTDVELTAGAGRLCCRVHLSAVTHDGQPLGVLLCVVDVTELTTKATRDSLTGLHNRASILRILADAIARPRAQVGVVFADLDHFKEVNDHYGHAVGDDVLRHVAQVFTAALRSGDEVGRLGGDEFLVVCSGSGGAPELEAVAARLEARLRDSVPGLGRAVGACLGLARYAGSGDSVEALVDRADQAMYAAKAARHLASWAGLSGAIETSIP